MLFIKWLHNMGKSKKSLEDLRTDLHTLNQRDQQRTIGGKKKTRTGGRVVRPRLPQ